MKAYSTLTSLIERLNNEHHLIAGDRKDLLKQLADYIKSHKQAQLVFICTHNSRRSHLAMIWAAVGASFFGLAPLEQSSGPGKVESSPRPSSTGVRTFSGGTEATAMNPRIVRALRQAGFQVSTSDESTDPSNPSYLVSFSEDKEHLTCFSKKYDHPYNPENHFAAIMVCSSADADCPFVPGADFRLALPYQDPKRSDNLPAEVQTYQTSLEEIGREILYACRLASS
ncbi:MAG: protein-tyrosine-phosphatase [Bacteroidota bacterium]